jgi:hypothetical protein
MKKLIISTIFAAIAIAGIAQPTLTAVSLLRPGANSTFLTTNGAGAVVWGNAASLLTAGTNISISGNTINATFTEVDGSITNEAQALSAAGTTSPTLTLSAANGAGGGTVTFAGGGIIGLTQSAGTITFSATEVDGSITNESQTLSASGTTSPIINLTAAGGAGGGNITFAAGSGIALAQAGGTITISNNATAGGFTFFKQAISTAGSTVTVSGFTPTITNSFVVLDGEVMEWGAGNDVTVSGNIITFSRTLEVLQKVLVIKVN